MADLGSSAQPQTGMAIGKSERGKVKRWKEEGRVRRREAMGGEREGARGAVLSRSISWWARTPTLLEARLANVAGWGEFKPGDIFFANGWNLAEAVGSGRKKCGEGGFFLAGWIFRSWVMGGREGGLDSRSGGI